jgi:NHLM bacteriocin system ABC transporter ATP-binding protein
MISPTIRELPGQVYKINGNQPFLLDDPQTVWLVQSGSVALFAVKVNQGVIEGIRRYLFSCDSGAALFGTASGSFRQLLVVPIGETELLKLDGAWFRQLITKGDDNLRNWIAAWLQQVYTVCCDRETESRCQGVAEITSKPDALVEMLSQVHGQLFDQIQRQEEREYSEQQQRLEAEECLNRQVNAQAIGELASTLATPATSYSLNPSPLLVAAGAVGKALGVPIRPGSQSEDVQRLREPLEAIMRASRIQMRRVLLREDWWKKDCGALVAYRECDNQLVVLLPRKATGYDIFDPVLGTRTAVTARNASTLTAFAWMFYRTLPDKVLTAWDVLQFSIKGRAQDLPMVLGTGIAATVLGMLTPQATAILMDQAIPNSDRTLLWQVGAGLFVAAMGMALFLFAQGLALLRVETVADTSTQAAVWERLLNLPVYFFRRYSAGNLQSRVASISQIRRQLGGTTVIHFIGAGLALLNLALLFYYSAPLAWVAVVVAVVAIALTLIASSLLVGKTYRLLTLQGTIFGQTVQLINGMAKLRIAGAQGRAFATWSKNYSRQVKLNLSTQQIKDSVTLFNTVMPTLASGLLFWLTMQRLEAAETPGNVGLSIGTFLAFNTAFGTFIKGVTDLSNTTLDVLQVIPQWQRLQPIVETRPEVSLSKADPGKLMGRIRVNQVSFRYRDDAPLILDNLSIHAEPGEFIAIVGRSGSGKSTLFRLLLGFETPESGTIDYDGQALSGLDINAVRRQLGVVLQNGRILSGSIFENIASGVQITLDEAWDAARMAGLADDIAAMPMEMHTVISEGGGNLSGGQQQRLLIARALVLKPRILLFDEATSALDNRTQGIVSASLDQLQVTRLVIAHRLSTIRHAHRIYVIEGGRIVQQGTFEELAAVEGVFAQLMVRQMV